MENPKRKQKTLTIAEKVRIIEDFESSGATHEALGRKYGVGSSSVTRFIQKKEELRAQLAKYTEHGVNDRKTMKLQSFPILEEVMFLWHLQHRNAYIGISSGVLREKAEQFFGDLQQRGLYEGQKLAFSDGWVRRFRDRFGLKVKRIAGEMASPDVDAYAKFKSVLLEKMVSRKLRMSQMYSAGESALFIKLLASWTVVLDDEKADRTQCTFMPCSNADGSNKLKLMVIGTEARCIVDVTDLPVSYHHSNKACMTRLLFQNWFHQEFVPAVRKFSAENDLEPTALLLLDNCTAHYNGVEGLISNDGLIEVMFLPPNVTSFCKPLDQAVINSVKAHYKRKLMLKLILENEHLNFEERLKMITLHDCIHWIAEAWDAISPTTIQNSWKKLIDNFPQDEFCPLEDGAVKMEEAEVLPAPEATQDDIRQLVAAVDKLAGTTTTDKDVEMWLQDQVHGADNNPAWFTSEILSDEEILDSALHGNFHSVPVECQIDESMDGSADFPLEPGFPDAMKAIDCLLKFVRDDAAEVNRLKALRTKLIEDEWRKRAP